MRKRVERLRWMQQSGWFESDDTVTRHRRSRDWPCTKALQPQNQAHMSFFYGYFYFPERLTGEDDGRRAALGVEGSGSVVGWGAGCGERATGASLVKCTYHCTEEGSVDGAKIWGRHGSCSTVSRKERRWAERRSQSRFDFSFGRIRAAHRSFNLLFTELS